jgi:hypothetical protein
VDLRENPEWLVSEQFAGLIEVRGEMLSTRCADFRAIEGQAKTNINKMEFKRAQIE